MLQTKRWPQDRCLANMRERYGAQVDTAKVEMYMTLHEVESYLGQMCKNYDPYCACCQAWVQWNARGTVSVTVRREDIFPLLIKMD